MTNIIAILVIGKRPSLVALTILQLLHWLKVRTKLTSFRKTQSFFVIFSTVCCSIDKMRALYKNCEFNSIQKVRTTSENISFFQKRRYEVKTSLNVRGQSVVVAVVAVLFDRDAIFNLGFHRAVRLVAPCYPTPVS